MAKDSFSNQNIPSPEDLGFQPDDMEISVPTPTTEDFKKSPSMESQSAEDLGFQPDTTVGIDASKMPFTSVPGATAAKRVSSFLNKMALGGKAAGETLFETGTDFGKGGLKGITIGTAPEIYGIGAGLKEATKGVLGDESIGLSDVFKKYRGAQEEASKFFEEGKERSPLVFGAGELLGSAAPFAATAGLGLTSAGVRAGLGLGEEMAFSQAAKAGGGYLSKPVVKELATRALTGAAADMPVGALMGATEGKGKIVGATPEEQDKFISDVLSGAATSGALGATISMLPFFKGTKKAPEIGPSKSEPYFRQVKTAAEMGEMGKTLGREATELEYLLKPGEYGSELAEKILKVDKKLGQEVGKSISNATKEGVKIPVSESSLFFDENAHELLTQNQIAKLGKNQKLSLNELTENVKDVITRNPAIKLSPKGQDIFNKISENKLLTPLEALSLKEELSKISRYMAKDPDLLARQTRPTIQMFSKALDETLRTKVVPYQVAAEKFHQFRTLLPEQFIAGSTPSEIAKQYLSKLDNPRLRLRESIEKMIEGATKEGIGSAEQKKTLEYVKKNVRELSQTNPEVFKEMGVEPEALLREIQKKADEYAVIASGAMVNPQHAYDTAIKKAVFAIPGTGKGFSFSVANKAKLALKKIKPVADFAQKIYNAPFEQLEGLGSQMMQSDVPGAKALGEALQKSVQNKNIARKNAILFTILQNPNYRNMINFHEEESPELESPELE